MIYLCIFECAGDSMLKISGDEYKEETPVPIPNTEVKLSCAENTCGLPCWEDKLLPDFYFYYEKVID